MYRLSPLLAARPADDSLGCSQGQSAILAFVSLAFNQTNKQVLKHLCVCPDCRKAAYEYRQTVLTERLQEKEKRKWPLCDRISISDIFDYVVPYGIDPATDRHAEVKESLTSHLRSCPECLSKMQELHRAVFDIVEQPESQIATIYRVEESCKAALIKPETLYAGFPIRIETNNHTGKSAQAIKFSTLSENVHVSSRRLLLKNGLAAAAVLLMAAAMFFYASTARAVGIKKIYNALEKISNVYILSFTSDKEESAQEKWISRDLNIYLTKSGGKLVLWDIKNKERRIKQSDTGSIGLPVQKRP